MSVTAHTGSSESVARLRLFEDDSANPGETVWAQLKPDNPMAVAKGDYFVIRSNMTTLGGGNIVDTHAPRPRRRHRPTIERLEVLERGDYGEALLKTIEGMEPAEFRAVVNRANLDADDARANLEEMIADGRVVVLGDGAVGQTTRFYTSNGWSSLTDRARASLRDYHDQFPLRTGAPKEELRSRLNLDQQAFNDVLRLLRDGGIAVEEGSSARLPEHSPSLSESQEAVVEDYLRRLESDPFSPPTDMPIDPEVVNLLDERGQVVKVSESVVFSAEAYGEMIDRISEYLRQNGEISVADARNLLGTSRKYALALMDHLDHTRVTRRVGDTRVLR